MAESGIRRIFTGLLAQGLSQGPSRLELLSFESDTGIRRLFQSRCSYDRAAVPTGLSERAFLLQGRPLQNAASVFPAAAPNLPWSGQSIREGTRRPQCLLQPSLRSHNLSPCVEGTRFLRSQISTMKIRDVKHAGLLVFSNEEMYNLVSTQKAGNVCG